MFIFLERNIGISDSLLLCSAQVVNEKVVPHVVILYSYVL